MFFVNLPVYLAVLTLSSCVCIYIFWAIYKKKFSRTVTRVPRRPTAAANAAGARRRLIAGRRPAARMRADPDVSDGDQDSDGNARPRRGQRQIVHHDSEEEEDVERDNLSEKKKIGAKKAAKLAEKERRKEEREDDERYREHQRKLEDKEIEKRKKAEEAEEQAAAAAAAAEAKRLAEEAAREQAEYELLKKSFAVEEEGTEVPQGGEQADAQLNASLVDAVKQAKVVPVEHLALEFGLKTETCVERLKSLLASGQLTGILDDRGKFVYVSAAEYEAVAQFVERRGRITLSELVENGPNLIKMNCVDGR